MNNKILSQLLQQRKDLIQLIFIAIILGLGVNILSTAIPQILKLTSTQSLWLGLFSVLSGIIYLSLLIIRARTGKTIIKAAVFIDPKNKTTTTPLHYEFMYDLSNTLNAVFQENMALKNTWHSHPLAEWHVEREPDTEVENDDEQNSDEVSYFSVVKMSIDNESNVTPSKSSIILMDAAEFIILEQLSYHLSNYFRDPSEADNIIELSRKDIPHILLENRVLNLLTTPIEDRAIFTKAKFEDSPNEGEVVSIRGSDGSVYQKFDLMLPKGTKVSRSKNGSLILDTNRVILSIRCLYEGFSESTPIYFEEAYLGVPPRTIDTLKMEILIETKIRLRALFTISGWQTFKWIDTFPDRLIRYADFQYFKEKIGWNIAFTTFHIPNAFKTSRKEENIDKNG